MSARARRWTAGGLTLGVAALLAPLAASCSGAAPVTARGTRPSAVAPVKLAPAEAETLRAALVRERNETLEWLKSAPTSYLATVQRRDFEDKRSLTVGRAAGNDVRIDDPAVEPHHLRVTVMGDSFHVVALDGPARFKVKDAELREATVGPSGIGLSRFTLRLSHQRFPAIIVFDPKSPHFAHYKGLHWFEPDLRYRYALSLTPNPKPDTIVILSTRGNQRRALRVGWFDFIAGGRPNRLEVTRLLEPGVGENDFGIFFRDATTGKQSYGLGRYVDAVHRPDGLYVLDFNDAYNPACAVSDHYNCPIPPKANTLKVAILAGEMDSHYH